MDGTFWQDGPLARLVGERYMYSFDLKSVTSVNRFVRGYAIWSRIRISSGECQPCNEHI